jgi:urease accessory protein
MTRLGADRSFGDRTGVSMISVARNAEHSWLRQILALGCMVATLVSPQFAHAHILAGEAGGLVTGFFHPISGLDHVVAMVAVGLWGAQLGVPAIWVLPVTFPLMMALGGLVGLLGWPLPGVEIGIALSAIMLGTLILSEARPWIGVSLAIVAFFAIFHGHAHGTELPEGQDALLYSMGFVVATGLLHAIGISIGLINRWTTGRVALRAAGGAVAAVGVYFLAGALL